MMNLWYLCVTHLLLRNHLINLVVIHILTNRSKNERSRTETYDRVLLQIDSTRDGNSSIIWGDLGIANILVKSTDLEAMKFDDYMYSWDCS